MSKDTRQFLIDHILDLSRKLDRTPSRKQFRESIKNAQRLLYTHFKSYTELLETAGLPLLKVTTDRKTIEELSGAVSFPEFPDDDIPVQEIIDSMCARFKKRKTHADFKKWMEFKIDTDLPIGVCWFGDPHIDDDGCDWPLLKEHIEICKNTPGLYGANIGDTHNNWVGRLMKEYASQETSRGTAFKLVDWFFHESGIKWLIILLGNHDSWNFGSETMRKICKNLCPMIDWRAQFKLKFSNGVEVLIDAAHDHSGHSQWNALHGQQKASSIGGIAHLYIAGHRHTWAIAQHECPNTNRVYNLARARGYKFIDNYAEVNGFHPQKHGASIVAIINPRASDPNRVKLFADVREGAEYLTYLRNKK